MFNFVISLFLVVQVCSAACVAASDFISPLWTEEPVGIICDNKEFVYNVRCSVDGKTDYDALGPLWWGEDQVAVVYCGLSGCLVSTYDVRSIKLVKAYTYNVSSSGGANAKDLMLIQPLSVIIKDQLLQGYMLKEGESVKVSGANFGLQDVDLSRCDVVSFASSALDGFVTQVCGFLNRSGEMRCPSTENPLVSSDVCGFRMPYAQMRWNITTQGYVRQVLQDQGVSCQKTTFVLFRDGCAFRGSLFPSSDYSPAYPLSQKGTLLYHKVEQAADEMKRLYAFSDEAAQGCLNYSCKDSLILWN